MKLIDTTTQLPDPTSPEALEVESSAEERLSDSSGQFLNVLTALGVMEREKRALPTGDARRIGLTRYIDELTIGLLLRNQDELRLVAEASGPPTREPRPPHVALTDREYAERRLRDAVETLRTLALTAGGFDAMEALEA